MDPLTSPIEDMGIEHRRADVPMPEQFLNRADPSFTHFRLYWSLGGDSGDVNRRKLAARQVAYLSFQAIGSLAINRMTPTPRPEIFATGLMNADTGRSNFEGYRGGAFHKVIRWNFGKQGLYQPPGVPRPVITPGTPPNVDIYINDGRNGEYPLQPVHRECTLVHHRTPVRVVLPFQPVHWECTGIWNRLAPSAGGGGVHETSVVGQTNFAYVRVQNRGTQHANNVVVRGYSANPDAGLSWLGDWTPMDTPQVAVAGGIALGAGVVVGPFCRTPRVVGHECMFMKVSTPDDLSNTDLRTFFPYATGPTPEWRLVPFDNNLAQPNVALVPGAGGGRGLLSGLLNRRFIVCTPFDTQPCIEVKAELPPFLAERGWRVRLDRGKEGRPSRSLPATPGRLQLLFSPAKNSAANSSSRLEAVAPSVSSLRQWHDDRGHDLSARPGFETGADRKKGGTAHPPERPGYRSGDPRRSAAVGRSGDDPRYHRNWTCGSGACGGPAEVEDTFVEAVPKEAGAANDAAASAGRLLSQLGVSELTTGRVNQVRLRKVTVETELSDA